VGSPKALLLEMRVRERIQAVNARRLQLVRLRATPPWQI
jgi:hypothetical protein